MARIVLDILFAAAVLIGTVYHFLVAKDMTVGEFYIALMLNYFGARYLLMSNIDYAFYEATLESEDKNE